MDDRNVRQRKKYEENVRTSYENVEPTAKTAGWTVFGYTFVTLLLSPFLYVAYVLIFVPAPFEVLEINLPEPPEWTGALAENFELHKLQKLFHHQVLGPESIVYDQGHIYTTTADGRVVHIDEGVIRTLAAFGTPPCGTHADEPHCGRPLGMRFDRDKYLVVADSYLGLYRLNVATGDFHPYFRSDQPIDGEKPKFLNDLDIDEEGMIYVTDSSTKWNRNMLSYIMLECDRTGRLIKFDPVNGTTQVLMRGLFFPNGVQISRNKEYMLVAELGMARIHKYHLKGPKAGQSEIFADNLPGLPDNIRLSTSGGYWVAMTMLRNRDKFGVVEFIQKRPWLRSFLARAFDAETILAYSGLFGRTILVQFNNNGEIIRTLQDPSGAVVKTISEVHDHNGLLYIGSYNAPYLGKLDLREQN